MASRDNISGAQRCASFQLNNKMQHANITSSEPSAFTTFRAVSAECKEVLNQRLRANAAAATCDARCQFRIFVFKLSERAPCGVRALEAGKSVAVMTHTLDKINRFADG